MNREDLVNNFKLTLRDMSLEQFARLFINEVTAVEDFYKLCHGINAGKTISLLFNPHRLNIITEHTVTRISNPMSIYESLSDEGNDVHIQKIDGLARLYLYNLENGVTNPFYATIQRGYNGVTYVNEFPPYVARQIIQKYADTTKPVSVLDPCGGWGGRMIGCASIPNTTYTYFEPATETFKGLTNLSEWLKTLQPSFKYCGACEPYEDAPKVITENLQCDIALTSPPYYDTEKYCNEETNSFNRYKTFETWVEGFYKPLILNTMKYLKDDAPFILNVGDRKYPLSEALFRICEENGLYCERITDYLSGHGDNGEKFYRITKNKVKQAKQRRLF